MKRLSITLSDNLKVIRNAIFYIITFLLLAYIIGDLFNNYILGINLFNNDIKDLTYIICNKFITTLNGSIFLFTIWIILKGMILFKDFVVYDIGDLKSKSLFFLSIFIYTFFSIVIGVYTLMIDISNNENGILYLELILSFIVGALILAFIILSLHFIKKLFIYLKENIIITNLK